MDADSTGRDLFIVDNSVTGWTGLRYLEEWTGIARAFDIATGFFEIGALRQPLLFPASEGDRLAPTPGIARLGQPFPGPRGHLARRRGVERATRLL